MPWVRAETSWQDQKIRIYRSRYDEAAQITAALHIRRQTLLTEIRAEDLNGLDTTTKARRLRQTDDELDLARKSLQAAWAALEIEESRHHITHQPREARR
ncbi:hypothetical protein [Paenarthrobacter nicotinovorans]|uniref:hypothetical protein n=1 Tax=Paenarthrobacter nicotinovorans TaxID=29320 RepID=UPI002484FAFB|nr:hypothetical protein [Paenarthrobacter nicotinovorans]MDI2019724.1 hypothetical protein [Paenarthrobacter nicotinovorans]